MKIFTAVVEKCPDTGFERLCPTSKQVVFQGSVPRSVGGR